MKPFTFTQPASLDQLLARKSEKTQVIAGGTNLVDLMKKNITQPDEVIDVTGVLAKTIQLSKNGIIIGAMVRNSALAQDPQVLAGYPLVSKAVLAGASPQIRNMASTGGNLLQRTRCPYFYDITLPCNKRNPGSGCGALTGDNRMSAVVGWSAQCVAVHPSDLCVALAALDANVQVADKAGKKSTIAFGDFHRLPGDTPQRDNNLPEDSIILSVDIPSNNFNKHFAYVKLRDRDSYAFALISVAAALNMSGNKITEARLASGGVAHKPWRWKTAEAFLRGKEATTANFRQAALLIVKELKPLSNNGFKSAMLQGAIEVALKNCITA